MLFLLSKTPLAQLSPWIHEMLHTYRVGITGVLSFLLIFVPIYGIMVIHRDCNSD
jgi:hypothetical protein